MIPTPSQHAQEQDLQCVSASVRFELFQVRESSGDIPWDCRNAPVCVVLGQFSDNPWVALQDSLEKT